MTENKDVEFSKRIQESKQKLEKEKAQEVKPSITKKPSLKDITKNIEKEKTPGKNYGDLKSLCTVFTGSKEKAEELFNLLITNSKNPDEELKDTDSYLHKLVLAIEAGIQDVSFEELLESLKLIKEQNNTLSRNVAGLIDVMSTGETFDNSPILTGEKARLAAIGRTSGLMKFYLYNSGFYLVIKSLNISTLNEFFKTVDAQGKEYGRVLGMYSFLTTDIYAKEKFAELIPMMVVQSNLKDWKKGNRLLNNISIHDYYTILWAACCMQFRDGVKLGLLCTNEDCKNVEDDLIIDLQKIRYNVYDKMSEEAITFVRSPDVKTPAMLENYRNNILGFKTDVQKENRLYHLKVPVYNDVLQDGLTITSKLIATLRGKADVTTLETLSALATNFFPMLLPWVDAITFLKDDNSVDFIVKDKDIIREHLEGYKKTESEETEDAFNTKILNFIKTSRLSYFCTSAIQCPKCGKTPINNDDFFPIDVEQLLFLIACRQLQTITTV